MVWRSRDDRKIARTNTVCHRAVYVPAVMCRQIIPNQNSMKVIAGDIVRLNILAGARGARPIDRWMIGRPVSPLPRGISPVELHGTTQDILCCRQNGGEARREGAAQAAAKSPAPLGLLQSGQQGLFPRWQA